MHGKGLAESTATFTFALSYAVAHAHGTHEAGASLAGGGLIDLTTSTLPSNSSLGMGVIKLLLVTDPTIDLATYMGGVKGINQLTNCKVPFLFNPLAAKLPLMLSHARLPSTRSLSRVHWRQVTEQGQRHGRVQCVAGAVDQRIWTDPGAVSDQTVALSLVAGWNNFISLAVCDATNCTVS